MSFSYMPLYTGDYLRDTQHLSMSEHGAYLKLLMYCWDQKGPAPLDERRLMGIVNARSTDEVEAMRRVLAEFFVRADDGHYNVRLQREIERSENISSARAAAGRKGYEARSKQLPSKSRAIAKQVHLSPSPSPSLTPLETPPIAPPRESAPSALDVRFDRFWRVYPKKIGKDAARKAFAKRRPSEALTAEMIAAVIAQRQTEQWRRDGGQFIPNPATWLNQGRWQDEAGSAKADAGIMSRAL